jgi:hypothetical protein
MVGPGGLTMKALMLLVLVAGCELHLSNQPARDLYWNPLTCRCHSGATGSMVPTSECLRPGVKLDACPATEE